MVDKLKTIKCAMNDDGFLDLSIEAQYLYLHLLMDAEDKYMDRGRAISRMLFSEKLPNPYKPLEELIDEGYLVEPEYFSSNMYELVFIEEG